MTLSKSDVLDEHKLSESAALASARVTSPSGDEHSTTTTTTTAIINNNNNHISTAIPSDIASLTHAQDVDKSKLNRTEDLTTAPGDNVSVTETKTDSASELEDPTSDTNPSPSPSPPPPPPASAASTLIPPAPSSPTASSTNITTISTSAPAASSSSPSPAIVSERDVSSCCHGDRAVQDGTGLTEPGQGGGRGESRSAAQQPSSEDRDRDGRSGQMKECQEEEEEDNRSDVNLDGLDTNKISEAPKSDSSPLSVPLAEDDQKENLAIAPKNSEAESDEPRGITAEILKLQKTIAAVAAPKDSGNVEDKKQHNDEANESTDSIEGGVAEEEYSLQCIYCPAGDAEGVFPRASLLRDHMRAAHPGQPTRYQCPRCEQTFLLKSHLDKHLALHSPTSQSCKVCQKTFANVYRLQRHMISHSESTDLRKFKCPECGKAFKFKHHLKEHIRIHSGEKPFQCPTCSKRFSHSGSYSSHMTSKKCWVVALVDALLSRHGECQQFCSKTTLSLSSIRTRSPGAHTTTLTPSPSPSARDRSPVTPTSKSLTSSPARLTFDLEREGKFASDLIKSFRSKPNSESAAGKEEELSKANRKRSSSFELLKEVKEELQSDEDERGISISKKMRADDDVIIPVDDIKDEIDEVDGEIIRTGSSSKRASPVEDVSDLIVGEVKLEMTSDPAEEAQTCRYCHQEFQSPVDLHQHERYMCELNHDIRKVIGKVKGKQSEVMERSAHKTKSVKESAETGDEEDDESEDSEVDDDNNDDECEKQTGKTPTKKLTENQAQHLRACFRDNKKPGRPAMEEIAKIIGTTRKLVQIWFESARARDARKRQRSGSQGASSPSRASSGGRRSSGAGSTASSTATSPSTYIPRVPNPYAMLHYHYSRSGAQLSPHSHKSGSAGAQAASSLPLNLSTRSSPLTPPADDQPLDLTVRTQQPPSAHGQTTATPPVALDEGQVLNLSTKTRPVTPKLEQISPNSILSTSSSSSATSPRGNHHLPHPSSIPPSFLRIPNPTGKAQPILLTEMERLAAAAVVASTTAASSISHMTTMATADAMRFQHSDLFKYMANNGLFKNGETGKHKQDNENDNENQVTDGEDVGPESWALSQRKRRRSWKGHRVSEELGLYACDQCDKQFSKQSSLARHKYEHSGARPFKCDMCTKAFKHKHHLTEHRRLHSGEKPFRCSKCGKRFSHSGSYSQHMNHRYKFCKPSDGEEEENLGQTEALSCSIIKPAEEQTA
ncbi:hypothetical protein EGW08_002559 [Elysia chlorotica]|uniref:Uncharacterized protein n=1 Tax=Elysia chlorotica TaxID=188477 RepID=A0A3S1BRA0_ELYCH|nr:hypothetical protein EGW08_002559 [Elysia chlorotica]